jgi:hypothetical protein
MFNVECWAFLLLMISGLSLHAQTVTNDLPKLAPAYGELPPNFWEQHQTVIIIAGFAVLAIVLLSLQVLLRPKTPVVLPPEAVARQALAKLQGWPEDGKMLSEIPQILRRYLCVVFDLPPAEMTTAEFSTALAANEKIGMAFAQMVSDFLRACDKEKFSPKTIAPPLNAVNRALKLIDLAEKRRVRPEGAPK